MEAQALPIALPKSLILRLLTLASFFSFAVPFALGGPQIIVGSIVNAGLFLSVIFLPEQLIYPLIFMPSLAILSRGIIFGQLTSFLVIMAPFIWLGNWLLVFAFKNLFNKKANYWLSVVSAATIKALFLFTFANMLFRLNLVPRLFLTTMGALQLATAILGGVLAFLIQKHYAGLART